MLIGRLGVHLYVNLNNDVNGIHSSVGKEYSLYTKPEEREISAVQRNVGKTNKERSVTLVNSVRLVRR